MHYCLVAGVPVGDTGGRGNEKIPVAMRAGDTPVLIPNTKVKTCAADGTMLETAWESRWLPENLKNKAERLLYTVTSSFRRCADTLGLPVIQARESS